MVYTNTSVIRSKYNHLFIALNKLIYVKVDKVFIILYLCGRVSVFIRINIYIRQYTHSILTSYIGTIVDDNNTIDKQTGCIYKKAE